MEEEIYILGATLLKSPRGPLFNRCVNLLGFLGVYGKTKDTPEAREDQQHMKDPNNKHTYKWRHYIRSYAVRKTEKEIFFACLSSIKVPAGFSSNIKGIINMADKNSKT